MIIDEFFRSSGKKTRDRNNLVVACLESDFRASKEYRMETSGRERKDRSKICGDFTARRFMATRRNEAKLDAQEETFHLHPSIYFIYLFELLMSYNSVFK